jgi:hypothetical protein
VADSFCSRFRPYTEKGPVEIGAGEMMTASVPWKWLERIKALEDRAGTTDQILYSNLSRIKELEIRLSKLELAP